MLYNGAFISFIMFGSALVRHMPEGRKIRLVFSIYMLASVIFVGAFVGTANWESDTSITDKLEEKGLDNGFATYWNANINTALSKNKVKTRVIILRDGQLFHRAYNNDYSWYQKEDSSDFFILLSPDEYDNVISADNQILTTEKKDELEISGYHVFVYSADQWDKIYLSN